MVFSIRNHQKEASWIGFHRRFFRGPIHEILVRGPYPVLLRRKDGKPPPLTPKAFNKQPKTVVFINEITKLVPAYKKKKNHFLLELKGTNNLHIKVDSMDDYQAWIEAITGLCEHYKDKKIFDWLDEREDYKTKIDVRIMNIIMAQQECT